MTDLFSESCCVTFYKECFSVAWWSCFMLCLRVLTCWNQPLHHNHSVSQPRIAPPTALSLTIIHHHTHRTAVAPAGVRLYALCLPWALRLTWDLPRKHFRSYVSHISVHWTSHAINYEFISLISQFLHIHITPNKNRNLCCTHLYHEIGLACNN